MVDWGAGNYERTAAELAPVAEAVVRLAALQPGERVIDLACGTGNAALVAAASGATVVGVDSAARLLDVARERARSDGRQVEFREGDLLATALDDDCADVLLSVFGVIFAPDPGPALGEVERVVRPGGRILISAWVPAGPINAMLTAMGTVVQRVVPGPPPERFPWSDADAVGRVARDAGLTIVATRPAVLAIRDSSPEAYVAAGQEHPMALAVRDVVERAGVREEVRSSMIAALREHNEDPDGLLVHSPYVVHELRAG